MNYKQTIFVTGANGFVGRNLTAALGSAGHKVILGQRSRTISDAVHEVRSFVLNDHEGLNLSGVDCVIHLASLVHSSTHNLDDFDVLNHLGTKNIAQLAMKQKVPKFIYLSSIGVNGSSNTEPFNELSSEKPYNPYSQSKYAAEQALKALSKESEMQVFIIRAPLIYGKGAPGNFQRLVKLASSNIPLPFGEINNERSFCGISNLCDFIMRCCETSSHELNRVETFLLADNEVISTTELFVAISVALNKSPNMIRVPKVLLKLVFRALGKQHLEISLLHNLTIDNTYAKAKLNWEPPLRIKEELAGLSEEAD